MINLEKQVKRERSNFHSAKLNTCFILVTIYVRCNISAMLLNSVFMLIWASCRSRWLILQPTLSLSVFGGYFLSCMMVFWFARTHWGMGDSVTHALINMLAVKIVCCIFFIYIFTKRFYFAAHIDLRVLSVERFLYMLQLIHS